MSLRKQFRLAGAQDVALMNLSTDSAVAMTDEVEERHASEDLDDFDLNALIGLKAVTKDAEKAFVKLLNPSHDDVKCITCLRCRGSLDVSHQ
ncbi:hypothetical protein [Rhizobium sp. CIAT894]|uniref:hypothetical protein n=1 Tax=Rhizobium sp. CIAT894 TaxID=2020312 RepID=UPI000A1DED93|nr:hypothetical protein [Rhizobium sp. CIAT894]